VKRRSFLGAAAALAVRAAPASIPIIDTHIHLFDTTRPQGVPWPDPKNTVLYRPALPDRYRQIAVPFGVKGAIEVEASPWVEDNQWVLDIAEKNPILVGTVGNLEPGTADFGKLLDRFQKNMLFRGIRNGNLWGRDLRANVDRPQMLTDLKRLAEADLSLDVANPNPELMAAVLRVTDRVPNLRVIVDHLPQMQPQPEAAVMREFEKRPQVFVKISEVFRRVNGQVPKDLRVYRATLDQIFATFGEDRVLYGSDWPNSDLWRPYEDVIGIVQEYFGTKSRPAAEKYFWKNSVKAYKWIRRDPSQPA
jgi:predicted TIM-barrel fold metal-dependent hydrolase